MNMFFLGICVCICVRSLPFWRFNRQFCRSPNTAIGWALTENAVGNTSHDSTNTFVLGICAVCSVKHKDFACGVF